VKAQGAGSVLACSNENGNPARLQTVVRNNVNLEFGLTLLGCAVPKIDGDLSDADGAIACVQNMFGSTPGPLLHYVTSLGGNAHSREQALSYMDSRGFRPVAARVTQTELPQLVNRVPLRFPKVEEPPPGKRSMINQFRFFDFVYDARISYKREVSFSNLQPKLKVQRSPHAEAGFLMGLAGPVAMLLDPSDKPQGGKLKQEWQSILYEKSRYTRLFNEPFLSSLHKAPPVHQCTYDQLSAAPPDDQAYLTFRSINLAFWSGPVPDAISPEALRAFQDPGMRLHPLLVIGPPVAACPETLGLALEVMATQFPEQMLATKALGLSDPKEPTMAKAEPGPEFGYLPRSKKRLFAGILARKNRGSASAANNIGIYLAFHRAFDATCRSVMTSDWEKYTLTRESTRLALQEQEQIRIPASELEKFYLAASSFVPVILTEHEEDPIKDFGSKDPNAAVPEVYALHVQAGEKNEAAFAEILTREGCRSNLASDLRAALSENLPKMMINKGETTLSMNFKTLTGARSISVQLDAPYDPDRVRTSSVISGSDAGLFPLGSDYGGRMLSYLLSGNFSAARREHRKSADEVVRQMRKMGPPGFNPIADFYEWGFQTTDNFSPMSALITSYIIRRVQVLGSCGDTLVPIARTYVEIETTRNGYGTEIMSREVGRHSEQVMVPAAFRHIVERAEDITPGVYSRDLVKSAISRLSCASAMRKNLEANMIAFNSGLDPAWVDPESRKTFGSSDTMTTSGESAYVYSDADSALKLIQEAARNSDSQLSLSHDFPDDSDKSQAQMNLLLINDIPAIVFNTRYFGKQPGNETPGHMVGLIMTCAGGGELDISQLLFRTEPSDLDDDKMYTLIYRAYGAGGKWELPVRLEDRIDKEDVFTFARFRGKLNADENTFRGLRLTSNFESYIIMGAGQYPLTWDVDGARINTTLAPLIEHCRSTGS